MKIYIHAGMHKTGTTTIQHFCRNNRKFLKSNKIYWPQEDGPIHPGQHSGLAKLLTRKKWLETRTYIDRAIAEAKQNNCQSVLLSGERFYLVNKAQQEILQKHFFDLDIKIIIYFRNIYEHIISVLSTKAKNDDLLADQDRPLAAFAHRLDYTSLIEKWEHIVGEENVSVKCYDTDRAMLIESFLSELGIEEQDHIDINISMKRNYSGDFHTLILFFLMDAFKDESFKKAYRDWAENNSNNYSKSNGISEAQYRLASSIFKKFGGDFRHPKLAQHKDILLKKPDLDPSNTHFKQQIKEVRNMLDHMLAHDI